LSDETPEATPPAEPFTSTSAAVYVNHLIVEFLRAELTGFQALVANEKAEAQDRTDAALVVAAADRAIEQLVAVNHMLVAEARLVQVAPIIAIPGARMPRGVR
jgi:hypothetical protein